MRLTFLVSSIDILDETWTTVHLAAAAARMGLAVRFAEPPSFEITRSGRLVARAWHLDPPTADRAEVVRRLLARELPYRYAEQRPGDVLMLRVNPLTGWALQLALVAQDLGVTVINDPAGVARTRSKAWLATLADVPRPAALVTSSRASAHRFAEALGRAVIVKPAGSSGGRGVELVPRGRPDMLDDALDHARFVAGGGPVVLQEYLPEAARGEKRLVWVCGAIVGGYLRRRSPGDFRHNLRLGGRPEACVVDEDDRRIAARLGPHLERNGIRIAGLDVIGGRLIEVNTLNPGGIHYAEATLGEPEGRLAGEALRRLLAGGACEGGTGPGSGTAR